MFFHWPWSGYYLLYILLSHLLVLNLFTSYMYMNSELFWTLRIWSSYLYTSMNPCFIQMLFCVSYVYILYMFIIEHRFRGWRYIASCDEWLLKFCWSLNLFSLCDKYFSCDQLGFRPFCCFNLSLKIWNVFNKTSQFTGFLWFQFILTASSQQNH